jgi:hypothetical protein
VVEHVEQSGSVHVSVHRSCRTKLNNRARKADKLLEKASAVAEAQQRITRRTTGGFSFQSMCFLCAQSLSGSKDTHKVMSGDEFDKRLMDIIIIMVGLLWIRLTVMLTRSLYLLH